MAILDINEFEDGYVFRYDVCVIGSGPAGLAVALHLARTTRKRIAVLEKIVTDRRFDLDREFRDLDKTG